MFNIFKKKLNSVPVCNCGDWPNPTWTPEMFLKKHELVKLCPVHKDLKMVMIATPIIDQAHIDTTPEPLDFGREIRMARIHLINAQQTISFTDDLWKEFDAWCARIEKIISEQK